MCVCVGVCATKIVRGGMSKETQEPGEVTVTMPELDLGPRMLVAEKDGEKKSFAQKRLWCPSRHVDWVNRQIQMGRVTPYPVTAVLSVEFVIADPTTVMRAGWLDEARCAVCVALAQSVVVVLDKTNQVTVRMLFRRQNAKSHYFVTTSGWADPFKHAFVKATLESAERTLYASGLPLRIAYVLTKPMDSFFIDSSPMAWPLPEPRAATSTSPPEGPEGEC